ncbi:hypothetical protein CGCF413_v002621 [Colletotrichum fructicola]|nr:hypothetical protein CGCF413_v002621 [Colletotrichum fructicola]
MEPADAPSDPFEVSLTTFKATLKKSEVENFRFATGDEFKTAIDQIQTKLHHKRRQLNLTKLRSFVEAMTQFGKVLDVFCQTSETIAFIWGPWKFLLQNVDSLFTAFDEILDTYDQLGQTLSLVLQATELFPEDKQMVKVVASIYDDILAFHREAFRYFQKSNAKRFIHAIFQTYQKTFEDLIQAIKRMFLLVSLIVENLMEQPTVEDLENELKPHTFPKSMNDAYERYMTRILSERSGFNVRRYCLLLFGWLVSVKRPLTWQEIQAAKSIDLDSQTVDSSNLQFLDNAKDLCGSLVEERGDGTVDLVHPTAKR